MNFLSLFFLFFLIIDPLGNMPVFISVLKNIEPKKRQKIIIREMCIALGLMILFLFCGKYIMRIFNIQEPSLSIAGGILLFLIAIKMIFPASENEFDSRIGDPFLVPLAIPMIAGPSILTMLLILSKKEAEHIFKVFLALFLAWSVSIIILLLSNFFSKLLGNKGIVALERLMGMILTVIAVQMFINGLKLFLT